MCLADFMDLLVRNEVAVARCTLEDFRQDMEALEGLDQ
jgi:hypothetical protein